MPVSITPRQRNEERERNMYVPANQGWMTARRMLSAVRIGSRARIRPSTACFEAVYCGALIRPIQDAGSKNSSV